MAREVWALRARRCYRVVEAALLVLKARALANAGVAVVHYSVQHNHIHLLVEAQSSAHLARAMQGFGIRVAKRLNDVMGRRGAVWDERYHAHVLSPADAAVARNVLAYVLNNGRKHEGRWYQLGAAGLDPCSSAAWFDGYRERRGVGPPPPEAPVVPPRLPLLRSAWRMHGLVSVAEVPGDPAIPERPAGAPRAR